MRIFVLGCGRMGSVLAVELGSRAEVMVWDPEPGIQAPAGTRKAAALSDIASFGPDMLLNCASLANTAAAFDAALPFVAPACVLADITSVKAGLQAYYAKAGHPFVSTHPMFGPTFADPSNLKNENAVVIAESEVGAKLFFRSFYESLGVRTYEYTFVEHDRTMAYSLSTPFASTLVFAACMKKQEAPGTTFRKHLAIAKGLLSEDDYLLSEVLFNPYTLDRIERINQKLSYLTHIIKARDYEEMCAFLAKLRENIAD